jgi:hypothetical protein
MEEKDLRSELVRLQCYLMAAGAELKSAKPQFLDALIERCEQLSREIENEDERKERGTE